MEYLLRKALSASLRAPEVDRIRCLAMLEESALQRRLL